MLGRPAGLPEVWFSSPTLLAPSVLSPTASSRVPVVAPGVSGTGVRRAVAAAAGEARVGTHALAPMVLGWG